MPPAKTARPSATPLTPETLCRVATACRVHLPEEAVLPLVTYLELLTQWNRVMNLVGTRHWEDTFRTLLVDSFHLAAFMGRLPTLPADEVRETWDLGAGAGLPGVPLRLLWQEGRYRLIEARQKRALFLSTVLAHVPLPGVSVFHGRAEQFMTDERCAHTIVSRAFMPWERLLQFTGPHLHAGGTLILLALEPVQPPAPWALTETFSYEVNGSERHLLALQKG